MSKIDDRTTRALGALAERLAQAPAIARVLAQPAGRHELGGLWSSSSPLALGLLARGRGRCVAVSSSPEAAEALVLDLNVLAPGLPVSLMPVEEEGLADGPELRANRSERLVALASLGDPGDGVMVVPAAVLLEDLPGQPGEELIIARGGKLDRDRLVGRLVEEGFTRVPLVAAPGEVSVRGDIVDVYPWASPHPLRVELFDDEVEDLRRFEVDSQTSVEVLDAATLRLGQPSRDRRRFEDVVDSDTSVFLVDPPRVKDRLTETAFSHDMPPREIDRALRRVADHPGADLFELDLGSPDTDCGIGSVSNTASRPLEDTVSDWREQGRPVVVLCDAAAEADRLVERLIEQGCKPDGQLRKGRVPGLHVGTARVTAGFAFPDNGPLLVHHHELIGRRAVRRRRPKRVVVSRALDSVGELSAGDYVVHLTHGVAIYRGMQRLARDQGEEDFLVLEFAEETTLYVPASRIDLVERFIGGGGESGPVLDRIGGKSWKRKKDKVRRAVEDLASQLLEVQTRRRAGDGFAFPPDDAMQVRFEATFPHEDTPDQHTSWSDVRGDMERERPMDRLLVGDVGFGKTEVAVRAAYKAVLGGKQVAVLVPTTILAEQHFEVFSHRMAEEPVRIEVLSRFRAGKHTKGVLEDLSKGQVDILIGTHKLLGKGVSFADLGLVIVDEEQRFGVAHKERLKQLKASVDVLTLSATPIPRTLHMSMAGLRDISSINTPPPGRRPVITKVGYDDDKVLRDAIRHEVGRGGQVFVLYNRVGDIERMVDRVRELAPTARTAVAHGQMASADLRVVVEQFANGEIDVLVCTTIVESGIDIPRANTMVVTDAHRFGLADMHQLRGRVGRESAQAYAHFLVPRESLPKDARQRLKAIEEFSSLGSGLPIALRDLELRGAGNLLGGEQSGHIMAVGYDTYCRLLRNAVEVAQGKRPRDEPGEIEVELGVSAYLPTEYVPDDSTRMSLLRRLASAGKRRLDAIDRELTDRFGKPPKPAAELLDLFRLRRLVRLAGLTSVLADGLGGVVLTLGDEEAWIERGPFRPSELVPVSPGRTRVTWPKDIETPSQRLRYLLDRFSAKPAPVGAS